MLKERVDVKMVGVRGLGDIMPSKYEVETKEIEFFLRMTLNILILFVLVLFVFSIIFPGQGMLVLTVIFIMVVGIFMFSTKEKIRKWEKRYRK